MSTHAASKIYDLEIAIRRIRELMVGHNVWMKPKDADKAMEAVIVICDKTVQREEG